MDARAFIAAALLATSLARAELPRSLDDETFRNLIRTLSEAEGPFTSQFMSNEDSVPFVLSELVQRAEPGGVYVGVGSEQNFTYIAALRPELAFIVDIRRDNLRQMLLYKALFEISPDRATFVSRLFSREPVVFVDPNASADVLFDAFAGVPADPELFESTRLNIMVNLVEAHRLTPDLADIPGMVRILEIFRETPPDTLKSLSATENPSYATLTAARDAEGMEWGFLASEERYDAVREMHVNNLIVPLVGDFAGDRALAGIAEFLEQRDAVLRVFYASNVEYYLWQDAVQPLRFYKNVALLPHDESSLFVRSVRRDVRTGLGIPAPEQPANWRTLVMPIQADLAAFQSGAIARYRDLFVR